MQASLDIAELLPTIWLSGCGYEWADKAWSILEEHGLTEYETDEDYFRIRIMGVAICAIYLDFCNVCYGERGYFETLCRKAIGEPGEEDAYIRWEEMCFFAGRLTDEPCPADWDSMEALLGRLEERVRGKVMDCVTEDLSLETIAVGLYYTAGGLPELPEDGEEEEAESREGEAEELPFWDFVDLHLNELFERADVPDLMAAYEWLQDGASRLGE